MSDLIDTTEMYLKTILEMEEDGVTPLRARIVERLGHSGPTVSQTVARMERDGLLHVMNDRRLDLTTQGRELATEVVRKHRLAERLLLDVIGLDWARVHEEACRWEHVMSDQVEECLITLLKDPTTDPYGNPIPGADSVRRGESVEIAVRSPEDVIMRIVRIGEPIQADENLIHSFDELDLRPGATVALSVHGEVVRISAVDEAGGVRGYVTIPVSLSPHLFVEKA
ncbi:metal-dependent transcriptional regulator [Schaalia vaccimaxillae]|uniref:metal-dependent transcriptional regulator n=1 Tax=Schaalia vaccimaxillae TaxID=183916 RepID=UPI0003B54E8F|nr:metal-dependent transcriptional regulator [Schaalia vaccimaxillae]